jgi:DNA-binding SARP family transcriptional activator/tetratricopeptide (TPR) repeat protein
MTDGRLVARLLGSFELNLDGRPIAPSSFERASGLRLLKLLLATPGHWVRREEAAELLWPEADPDRSAANLRKAIHFARRAIAAVEPRAEGLIESEGDALRLDPAAVEVDADALASANEVIERATVADQASAALDTLVRLGGLDLLPSDPYDEWLVPIRERLRQASIEALIRGAGLARASSDRVRGFALVERALALEPADERAHRIAIELHLDAGELHAARRRLMACRHAVAQAYGVEPDPALEQVIAAYAANRAAAATAAVEAPIVGRRLELAEAERVFDLVASGRSSGVVLSGAAGMGKSRILRELAGSARASGATVLELHGLEGAAQAPFTSFADSVVRALGGGILDDMLDPGRSALLTIAPSASATKPTIEFASEAAVVRALLEALDGTPGTGPIALVVDDAQWLDEGTLGILRVALANHGTDVGRPVLALLAIRTDASVAGTVAALLDAVESAEGAVISVGALGPREVRILIERELDGGRLDDVLATQIEAQAAGAPLFALEVLRSAREAGLLEVRDGAWALRAGTRSLPVPSGVKRLVERRVSRLDPAARTVLATAAELGDVVTFEDLVATETGSDAVLDAVEAAIGLGIISALDTRYAFAHPLYRAALRASLPPRARADIHRRVMTVISGGLDPFDDDAVRRAGAGTIDLAAVASHAFDAVELGRSDLGPTAVAFGIAAGERQANLFDRPGAVATLQRALRLWHRLPTADRALLPASEGNVQLGQALRRMGDDAAAVDAFRTAVATARDDRELAGAYVALAWLPYEHGRYPESISVAREGIERLADPIARATLETTLGWVVCRHWSWAEGLPILRRAVDALEAGGSSPALVRALDRLGVAAASEDPHGAVAIFERARWMAIELAQTVEQATIEMHLGAQLGELGRFEEALAALDRGRVLCSISGEEYIATVIEWNAAQVAQQMGRLEEAIEHRRRELAIFREIGPNPRHEALAHAHIAHLARQLGLQSIEDAEAALARASARTGNDRGLEAHVDWALLTDDWFAEAPQPGNATGTP